MNRKSINIIIDGLGFVTFILLTTTGLLMHFILPPGSGRFVGLWGMDRHEWGHIHYWISISFLAILALHLILHWRWIASVIKGQPAGESGYRIMIGIVALIALLVLAFSPFFAEVKPTGEEPPRKMQLLKDSLRLNDSIASPDTLVLHPAVEKKEEPEFRNKEAQQEANEYIKGSMTLGELEEQTGIPYRSVLMELGISEDIPPDERLGRLSKLHGFDMTQVRETVEKLQKR
jgi:hypothetical protein